MEKYFVKYWFVEGTRKSTAFTVIETEMFNPGEEIMPMFFISKRPFIE